MCSIFYHLCWVGQSRVMIKPKVVGLIPIGTIHLTPVGPFWLRTLCDSVTTKFNSSSEHQRSKQMAPEREPAFLFKVVLDVTLLPSWCVAAPEGQAEKCRVQGSVNPSSASSTPQYGQRCHKWRQSSREKCLLHRAFICIACVSVCPMADGGLAMADVTLIPDQRSGALTSSL